MLGHIASGAYGEVWLARNVVGTLRAVKIVRRDRHASAESFEREFKGLQKFEPVSRTHDGLVDILTLGLLPGGAGFYYVMELADGGSESRLQPEGLESRLQAVARGQSASTPEPAKAGTPNENRLKAGLQTYSPRTLRAELRSRGALPADEVISLGLKLTAALAHLHAHGLVHRDVKPSNILFIGGEPKLADAGLVAAMDDARSLVGTAGYIAPEGPGKAQADLYALGKVLYEAAFGKDRQEFPALPADVASRTDHARLLELNAILLKACATDCRERYQSADQMRADLELLHEGRSVKRRQAWQEARRLAVRLGAAAAVIMAAWFLFKRFNDSTLHRSNASTPASIFVLPFRNDGSNQVQEVVRADGTNQVEELVRSRITDAIIDGLEQIGGVKVGPRKSGWIRRDEAELRREIKQQFGPRYVVSGKVRAGTNELAVTLTVHDTASDRVLWSDSFSGTVAERVELEERIIRGTAERLGLKISVDAAQRITQKLQNNLKALEAYQESQRRRTELISAFATEAIERLTHATELDPNFVQAHMALSFTYRLLAYYDREPKQCMPRAGRQENSRAAHSRHDEFAVAMARPVRQIPLRIKQGGAGQPHGFRDGRHGQPSAPTNLADEIPRLPVGHVLQDLPHHDAGAPEGRLAVADARVRHDVFA